MCANQEIQAQASAGSPTTVSHTLDVRQDLLGRCIAVELELSLRFVIVLDEGKFKLALSELVKCFSQAVKKLSDELKVRISNTPGGIH